LNCILNSEIMEKWNFGSLKAVIFLEKKYFDILKLNNYE